MSVSFTVYVYSVSWLYFAFSVCVSQVGVGEVYILCCREGHLDVVRYLVTEADCDPDVRDDDQDTPLHTACRYTYPCCNVVSNPQKDTCTSLYKFKELSTLTLQKFHDMSLIGF